MYIFIYICSYAQREKQIFEWNIKFLKIITGRRQTSWLFTQRAAEEMNLGRWGGPGTNPMSSRVEGLNPGPPDHQCPNQPSHTASTRGKSQNTNSYHVVVWWKVLTFIFESKSLLYYCLGWSQVSPKHCRSSKSWKQATSWKDDWKRANNGIYGFHQQTSWQRWWWYWKTRHWHVGKTYHQITRSKLHLWKSARWYGQN